MEPTTPAKTKYSRLQATSTRTFSVHECDNAVIADAIDKALRGEAAWSHKTRTESALGRREITSAVLHYRMDGVDNALDDDLGEDNPREHYVPITNESRPNAPSASGWKRRSQEAPAATTRWRSRPTSPYSTPTSTGRPSSGSPCRPRAESPSRSWSSCSSRPATRRARGAATTTAPRRSATTSTHTPWWSPPTCCTGVVATNLLYRRENALERQLENAVRRYGASLLNEGESATITIRKRNGSHGHTEIEARAHAT